MVKVTSCNERVIISLFLRIAIWEILRKKKIGTRKK